MVEELVERFEMAVKMAFVDKEEEEDDEEAEKEGLLLALRYHDCERNWRKRGIREESLYNPFVPLYLSMLISNCWLISELYKNKADRHKSRAP